jgi:hypothetical protein
MEYLQTFSGDTHKALTKTLPGEIVYYMFLKGLPEFIFSAIVEKRVYVSTIICATEEFFPQFLPLKQKKC